jgi:hypothetical protein
MALGAKKFEVVFLSFEVAVPVRVAVAVSVAVAVPAAVERPGVEGVGHDLPGFRAGGAFGSG